MALNISTEGLAHASARRPWIVVGVWVAVVVASIGLTSALLAGALTSDIEFTGSPESKRAETLLEEKLRGPEKNTEIIIVQSANATVDDAAFRRLVEDIFTRVSALGPEVITAGNNFYMSNDPSLVSEDRRTTISLHHDRRQRHGEGQRRRRPRDRARRERQGRLYCPRGRNASVNEDFDKQAETDLQTGEAFGIPLALGVLVIVFGAVAAALIPVVLAIVSIAVAMGLTALLGQFFQLSFFVTNVMTMIGLTVGIDYSLFIVSRYREERSKIWTSTPPSA
jgi:RND superfamily putative drug exporter